MLPKNIPSLAQIKANRENSQKSSGPRSAAGKDASSRNAITHGLTGKKHILPGEEDTEFDALLADLNARFRPVGLAEEKLVHLIAADQWRLDRAIPWEAGILLGLLNSVDVGDFQSIERIENHRRNHAANPAKFGPAPDPPDPAHRLSRAFVEDARYKKTLGTLNRYQAAVQRSIDHSLRQLKIYQEARRAAEIARQTEADAAKPAAPIPDSGPSTAPKPPAVPVDSERCESNPISGSQPPAAAPQPPLPAPSHPPKPCENGLS